MKRNQKGLGHIAIVLVILVVAAVGFAGWWVWHNNDDKNKATPTQATSTPAATETKPAEPEITLDKTYTDTVGKFSFNYPSDWKVKTKLSETEPKSSLSTLSSPTGTKLLTYAWAGGGFGFCEGSGSCGTFKYLTYEDFGQKALVIGTDKNDKLTYTTQPLYLVTLSETPTTGKVGYYIGLTPDSKAKTKVGKVLEGASGNFGNFLFTKDNNKKSSYPLIAIYASSPKSTFLASDDVKTIEAMLKTFEYTK